MTVVMDEVKPFSEDLDNGSSANKSCDSESCAQETSCVTPPRHNLLHGVDDRPAWYLSIMYAFQHFLTMVGGDLAVTLVFVKAMCVTENLDKAQIFGTVLFGSGLATILQSLVGSRLPIVQVTTVSFLTPTLAMMNLPKWACPDSNTTYVNDYTFNSSNESIAYTNAEDIWNPRMREIQGAVIMAGLFETLLGATGLIGYLMRYIGPITICPTITLIGLSLLNFTAATCEKFWWISLLSTLLVLLFSQYLKNIPFPVPVYKRSERRRFGLKSFPLFMAFPIILAILLSWLACGILTWTGAVTDQPGQWGYDVRVDTSVAVMHEARWFRIPYPFQWGWPTFSLAGTLGMMTGAIASTVESIGDYHACAKLAGAPPPPKHAINRGITVEGLSCMLAGIWGTGNATTSNSGNIAVIGITKVGSRCVVVLTGLIMVLTGIFCKFGAFFVSVPDPVMGGIFMVLFGTITAVGLSNLQYVDLNSSRNLMIIGFSIFFGLALPNWVAQNQEKIDTGVSELNQILSILLSTHMFVGGAVAFILDNTIAGTPEERGISTWREDVFSDKSSVVVSTTYMIPICIPRGTRSNWTKYFPMCPKFGEPEVAPFINPTLSTSDKHSKA